MDEETLNKEEEKKDWDPSQDQKARIKFVYDERQVMVDARTQSYPQFNDRTLKDYIDDSEKRLNAYVLDKSSQGKEDWQSNFATRAHANKAKALLAATSRELPDMKFKAVNDDNQYNYFAAEMMKNLTRHSYAQGNPVEEMFFLSWSNVGKGTVLSYEGYEKQNFIKKRIKSFDLLTGDVQDEEVENASQGEPVSYEIPLMNFLIKNFYIRDIQEQPAIIFESFYADKERFDANFGKYPNAKFVKHSGEIEADEANTYFKESWKEELEKQSGYLVSRYMNKYRDVYRIVANGVELYNGPMLWIDITRKNFGRKVYPIAKTIFEPFATSEFFYGNSMPNAGMGEADVLNTLYNTALDKTYRSMVPPLLVGQVNKDMLDLEDEVVAGDTKIYVDDINQVEQMDIKGITDSDVKMIELISRGLDLTTLDPQQQGMAQKYVTARAAVGADERARQLKGLFFMFMESLWLQKVRLRVPNILLSYTKPKLVRILGEENAMKLVQQYRTFNVENTELSDGSKGTMAIQFMPREEMTDRKGLMLDINAEEQRHATEGKAFEKIIMPYDYLDQFSFDMEIIPETLWQSSQSIAMAMSIEKIQTVAAMFPEYFASNKEIFFRDLIKNYNDDPSRYKIPETMSFEDEKALELAGAASGNKQTPGSQRVSDLTGVDRNNKLSSIVEQ